MDTPALFILRKTCRINKHNNQNTLKNQCFHDARDAARIEKLDVLRHQGKENELDDIESADAVGKKASKNGRQIRRYVWLTELIYPLLDKVDIKIIPVTAGAEVSFLNVKLQVTLNDQIDFYECRLSTKQAIALKRHYMAGTLDGSVIREILFDYDETTAITLNYKKLRAYFPPSYTAKQCETAQWEILDWWHQI